MPDSPDPNLVDIIQGWDLGLEDARECARQVEQHYAEKNDIEQDQAIRVATKLRARHARCNCSLTRLSSDDVIEILQAIRVDNHAKEDRNA